MSKAQQGLVPAYIVSGRVTDVDPIKWTMTVKCDVGEKTYHQMPIPGDYLHPSDGEGNYFIPEVGAFVWACKPSEVDRRPFVVKYSPPSDDSASHRANRFPLSPGSFNITTRDRNGLRVHRGGVTEIFGSPLSKTIYSAEDDSILNIAANVRTEAFGGYFHWDVAFSEEDPDGKLGTLLSLGAKEFADDEKPIFKVQIGGQIDAANSPIFFAQWFNSGSDGQSEKAGFRVTKNGEIFVDSGAVQIHLAAGASVKIFTTSGMEEGVILGKTYLQDQLTFLISLQAAMSAFGLTVPGLPDLITKISTSVGTGGAPYLSTRLKTE